MLRGYYTKCSSKLIKDFSVAILLTNPEYLLHYAVVSKFQLLGRSCPKHCSNYYWNAGREQNGQLALRSCGGEKYHLLA